MTSKICSLSPNCIIKSTSEDKVHTDKFKLKIGSSCAPGLMIIKLDMVHTGKFELKFGSLSAAVTLKIGPWLSNWRYGAQRQVLAQI